MTDGLFLALALLLTLGAALGFHRAQTRRDRPLRERRRWRWAALSGMVLALPLYSHATGPTTGPFVALAALMLACVALPYLRAWRETRTGSNAHGP